MSTKALPFFSLIALVFLVAGYFFIQLPREAARKDALSFSNTAAWEPALIALVSGPSSYPAEPFDSIVLAAPPQNSSAQVESELQYLKRLATSRTAKAIEDIHLEKRPDTTYFSGYPLATYFDRSVFPATATLLEASYTDLILITMREKQKFDRVRPSVLDPAIEPALPVPGHPSYPSGHSAQMHFLAHVFSELDPARRDYYFARASQIATNREIAGLHYPSDTEAGKLLAQQFFDIMMRNEKFLTLLAAAKREWATHPALERAPATP